MNTKLYKSHINNNILLYPILLGGGTNIGPYWLFNPSPSLASAKVIYQGAEHFKKNKWLMIFYGLMKKVIDGSYKNKKKSNIGR